MLYFDDRNYFISEHVYVYSINLYRGSGTDLAGTYNNPASGIIIHRDKTGDTDKLYVVYFFLCQQPQRACAPKAASKYLNSFNCICYISI